MYKLKIWYYDLYSVLIYIERGRIENDVINDYYLLIDLVFIFYVYTFWKVNSKYSSVLCTVLFVSCLVL